MHPRTREQAAEFGFEFDGIWAIEPLGFLEFLQLGQGLAPTDSGGGPGGDVHSGSSGVTLLGNTERPEKGGNWANTLAGARVEKSIWRWPCGQMIADCSNISDMERMSGKNGNGARKAARDNSNNMTDNNMI